MELSQQLVSWVLGGFPRGRHRLSAGAAHPASPAPDLLGTGAAHRFEGARRQGARKPALP